MMTTTRVMLATALSMTLLCSSPASADWLVMPFVGGNFGGDSVKTQTNVGVSAAWMGAGMFGLEFDAGWAPDFLDQGLADEFTVINESAVGTYMVNAIIGAPVENQTGRGVRPYASLGVGAIQLHAKSDLGLIDSDSTDLGWNAGGGAVGFFHDMIGVRGDLRYFRSVQNDLADNPLLEGVDRFGFWRLTGGVVFRFGRSATP